MFRSPFHYVSCTKNIDDFFIANCDSTFGIMWINYLYTRGLFAVKRWKTNILAKALYTKNIHFECEIETLLEIYDHSCFVENLFYHLMFFVNLFPRGLMDLFHWKFCIYLQLLNYIHIMNLFYILKISLSSEVNLY